MTDLQQTELRILREFARVCGALELPWFLVCGSALGAVKYQGFIPWDDDIDVAMYREDYERFCREAPAMLPEGLFLQNRHSQPGFPQIYSKLRDSRTTYIEVSAAGLGINHGVFIDIFPLDGYPRKKTEKKLLEFRKRLYGSMLLSAYDVPGGITRKIWLAMGIPKHTDRITAALERLIRRYPVEGSELVCNHGNWQGVLDYAPASCFGRGRRMAFEEVSALVPEEVDAYLRRKYGDYRPDPPQEEQVGHHTCTICDCQRSYRTYCKQMEDTK